MVEPIWKPHTTVAAIAERDGQFLLVEEEVDNQIVFNQPAGHLEPGESLVEAVIRETLEETRYRFTPTALQGIYRYPLPGGPEQTYIRFLFRGEVGDRIDGELDQGIISAPWMSYEALRACRRQHRSPMVLQAVTDFMKNPGFPLQVISQVFA